jgi:DNA modification methylase
MKGESKKIMEITKGHSSAESRWARFGPYYAMFPMDFSCEVVSKYSRPGDLVLDPFAGSNTTGWCSEKLSRKWVSIEMEREYGKQSILRFEDPAINSNLFIYGMDWQI